MMSRARLATRKLRRTLCIALVGISMLATALVLHPSDVAATPPNAASPSTAPTPAAGATSTSTTPASSTVPATTVTSTTAAPANAATAPSSATPPGTARPTAPTDGAATAQGPTPEPTTATIIFATTPATTAIVTWGKKKLGQIKPGKPLVVVRPRDSGPLDVVIRSAEYLPVQTRAHTFSDNRVLVKLTPPESKSELLGYRAPLDAGVEAPEEAAALNALGASTAPGADAGVPKPPASFQVVPQPTTPGPWLP